MNKEAIAIEQVKVAQIDEIVAFVRAVRRELYPHLDHQSIPPDLLAFEDNYINHPEGVFLAARDAAGKLIGTIGMISYNARFDEFSFDKQRVTEVVKLFVEPSWRRQGLASRMVTELKQQAEIRKIETLYLHTHPFLPGAQTFWKKQGFNEIITAVHSGFETIHMAIEF